jgi:ATP-dependent DNA ligase
MNRLAELIDRLATLRDDEAKAIFVADHLAATAEADRGPTIDLLLGRLKPRTVRLALIRGLADARVDSVLFELARDYTGDLAETIALVWPPRRGANKDPSLAEVIEGFSTLGRSELPKRLEAWLDAADANGRWALIKLATGTLRADVTAAAIGVACTQMGITLSDRSADAGRPTQDEMFAPSPEEPVAGTVTAVLMYVERTNPRAKDSPLRVTFGLWDGDELTPIGKADLGQGPLFEEIERFVDGNTVTRFGPVREVVRTRDAGLVLDIAFDDIERAARRRAGLTLMNPRITRICVDAPPASAAALATFTIKRVRG